jgi:hypothetical protein
MTPYLAKRGLPDDLEAARGHGQMFAVRTDRQVLLATFGGVFKTGPRDLVIGAPLAASRLEWWDESHVGPDQRHLLFLLGDQRVRHSAIINARSNIEAFMDSWGDAATMVRG